VELGKYLSTKSATYIKVQKQLVLDIIAICYYYLIWNLIESVGVE
jgi:hypothetical protein